MFLLLIFAASAFYVKEYSFQNLDTEQEQEHLRTTKVKSVKSHLTDCSDSEMLPLVMYVQ